jgi:hypothetical protein
MTKNKNQQRQGDVLIEKVSTLPEDCKPVKGRVILAHGEATGHAHEIDMTVSMAFQRDNGETVAVKVLKPSEVRHQEHAPIPVKRGTYRITPQREYSPEAIRNVAD